MAERQNTGAPRPTGEWLIRALLAAAAALTIGMLLLGLPGAIVLTLVQDLGVGRRLHGDSVWPIAIGITVFGSLTIVPASLALRYLRPGLAGWGHAGLTALVTLIASIVIAVLMVR